MLPNCLHAIRIILVSLHVKYFFSVAFAGLNIWPSFHDALSDASVFVEYSTDSNVGATSGATLSLVNMETNTTVLTRTLPNNQRSGRVEFNCSCFLYAGTFRFLLRQTRITPVLRANGTGHKRTEGTVWRWSSELQVHWPTFHIAVETAGNHSGSFQVRKTVSQTGQYKINVCKVPKLHLSLSRFGYPLMITFRHVRTFWTLLSS